MCSGRHLEYSIFLTAEMMINSFSLSNCNALYLFLIYCCCWMTSLQLSFKLSTLKSISFHPIVQHEFVLFDTITFRFHHDFEGYGHMMSTQGHTMVIDIYIYIFFYLFILFYFIFIYIFLFDLIWFDLIWFDCIGPYKDMRGFWLRDVQS